MSLNGLWNKMVNLSPTTKIGASLVLKDAVGCVFYTTTARRNKDYTPEKRSDVANYDLMNGIINISLQLLAIKPIEYFVEKKVVKSKLAKKVFPVLSQLDVSNAKVPDILKRRITFAKGATALLTAIICQYGIKRFISPYFSVPAGEWSKQQGFIKPKLYAGETYTPKSQQKGNDDKLNLSAKNTQLSNKPSVVLTA